LPTKRAIRGMLPNIGTSTAPTGCKKVMSDSPRDGVRTARDTAAHRVWPSAGDQRRRALGCASKPV
jgi:hypothetical protein